MIIVQLIGGLGNQMFQYAAGRKMSIEKGTELLLDVSAFEKYPLRTYGLSEFNTTAGMVTKRKAWLSYWFQKFGLAKKTDIFLERDDYGRWNHPKYFEGIEDVIQKEFTLKNTDKTEYKNILLKIQSTNSISLHVRRADYLAPKNKAVFIECTPEYYAKAVEYMVQKTGPVQFFVFSDDINWVKENLKTEHEIDFISGKGFTDAEELMLMSACKHNITANSTFSWWGAWLNQNTEKIVITPKKWFIDEKKNNEGIIPKTWIPM